MEYLKKILETIKKSLRSYLTTIVGMSAGAVLLVPFVNALLDSDPETIPVWRDAIIGLGMALIGFFAKDSDAKEDGETPSIVEVIKDKVLDKVVEPVKKDKKTSAKK